jgi:hypothetical protein
MKLFNSILLLTFFSMPGLCADMNLKENTDNTVFRQPFTLKLRVNKEYYYEQKIGKVPYIFENNVYLFKGDSFGIDLNVVNGSIQSIAYQSDTNKAAVTFQFTEDIDNQGETMMMLEIENRSNFKLLMDAVMVVHDKKSALKTSILPIEAGRGGVEIWPHPIVQLVLNNIRISKESESKQRGPANENKPAGSK